jgi:hypothetical protein
MSNARDDNEIAWQLHTLGQKLGNIDYKIRHRTISTRDEEWEEYTIEYNRKKKDR